MTSTTRRAGLRPAGRLRADLLASRASWALISALSSSFSGGE